MGGRGDSSQAKFEVESTVPETHDAGGKLLAEYNSQNYPESGTRFRIGDHLGSTRLLFDLSGNILQRFDYLPFGEELLTSSRTTTLKYGVASIVKQRFTGQIRDGETNLDYFNARYLSPHQGRFMSVDPGSIGARVGSPQTWNAYSYTVNNPFRFVDPTGTKCVSLDGGGVGDDGEGDPCGDRGLLLTHGATVRATGEVTFGVYGNAVLMGDIDLSGNSDKIVDESAEVGSSVLPLLKAGLAAGAIGMAVRGGSQSLLQRVAVSLGLTGARLGETAVVGTLPNGALVSLSIEVSGKTMTATIHAVAGAAGAGTGSTLLPLGRGLVRAAAQEGVRELRIVAKEVGNQALAGSLSRHGFNSVGSQVVRGVQTTTFVRTVALP